MGDGNSSRRRSWIAPVNGNYMISLASSGSSLVSYRVVDMTLFNPRWSTFSGFITQWGFKNTTSSSVTCTLTANDTLGSPSVGSPSISFAIGAGASVFKIIGPGNDINVPAQHGGDALLACANGVPGAIKGDAYFIGGGLIVPSTFAPTDYQF